MPQVTREIQIKATLRYYFAPVRMTIIEKSEKKNECRRGCGEKRNPYALLVRVQINTDIMEIWRLLKKLKNRTTISIQIDPAISLLGIYIFTQRHSMPHSREFL